jgi:hypothetical protein
LVRVGDAWHASYSESLTAKFKSCEGVAAAIFTDPSLAVEQDAQMPSQLTNKAKQTAAIGICGYFVVHWAEAEETCRRALGEGKVANG